MLTHSAEELKERKLLFIRLLPTCGRIIISVAESVQNNEVYKHIIKNHGLPIVFFDRCVYGIGASCVSINDEESARMITNHLIKLGYKKIAHLSGPVSVSIGKARMNGFLKAMAAGKLNIPDNYIVEAGFHMNWWI